jgi:DNA modification methylase
MPLAEIEKRIHPDNENKHPDEQIRSLAKVIAKIGIRHSIHISKQSGKIAGGHGRFMAFKKLGYDEAPIVWENFNDELEELNYRASDNLGQYAEFSNEDYVKNLEIAGIDIHDVDLEEFGVINFEFPEVETLEPQCDEDEVPEVENPITRRGDIWLLGNHRLMCGDSTMIDDVEKLMNGEKADMVYTDPPYGMKLDVDYDKMFKDDSHKNKGDRFEKVIADDSYFDPTDILAITDHVKEVWLWGADYFYDSLPRGGSLCAWDKRNENLDKVVGNTTEYLWSKTPHRRMTARVLWSGHHGMGKDDDKKRVHPTQKPITLHDWFFENFGSKHKKILDLFGGSGSCLVACEKHNKENYSMELDEKYCDVIINRWQNYTGKKATLESTGQTYEELKQEREDV